MEYASKYTVAIPGCVPRAVFVVGEEARHYAQDLSNSKPICSLIAVTRFDGEGIPVAEITFRNGVVNAEHWDSGMRIPA